MSIWIRTLIGAGVAVVIVMMISVSACDRSNPTPTTTTTTTAAVDSNEHPHGQIIHITTKQQFDGLLLQADRPILVDFYATWCAPCKRLAPIIERLANEYAGKVEFLKVDGDQLTELMSEYDIQGYPTVMIFSDGKPVKTMVGLWRAGQYRDALDAALTATN